jgi:hypothetical protein
MGDPSGNYAVTTIIPSYILFKERISLFRFWGIGSCEELNFKHFNMEGDSNKGVKRVINNNTTVKIN